MSVDMNQFHSVFFDESVEHLQTMEELLLNISVDDPDPEDLNSIFRAAHSIKGGSGIFGFDALTGITHVMETILDKARNHELGLTTEIVDTLLATCDILTSILNSYQDESDIDYGQIDKGIAALNHILDADSPSDNSNREHTNASNNSDDDGFGFFDDEPDNNVSASSDDDGFGFFDEEDSPSTTTTTDTDEGFGFFDDEPSAVASPDADEGFGFFDEEEKTVAQQEQAAATAEASNEQSSEDNKRGYGFFVKDPKAKPQTDSEAFGFFKELPKPKKASEDQAATAKKAAAAKDSSSVRVDTNKIDSVVNLVGEMVITQSMLSNIGKDFHGPEGEKLESAIDDLARNVREIQEAVMSMRMLPVSFVFNRFPRLVRDLAGKLGKKIDLVIEGGNTEVDKSMIEKLTDPLTHLVRNSLDHGIEPSDVRVAMGKPETGTVVLKAEQRGGNILISISDDGGGLNRDKILEKARKNGMDVNDTMPDNAVWKLIFEPGFSTAEAVTDVSGRGVGMDVVKRNIEAIKGGIDIESSAGNGSTFTIRLPLTLAIVDGMTVAVGDDTLVIPLTNIIESIQPTREQMKTLKNDTLLLVRDEYWPLVPLHSLLDIDGGIDDATKAIVVLIESSRSRFGLLVDNLIGQQQVVIKSLEQHYRKVPCVAGATIMGDGSVALILDIESIATTVKELNLKEMADAS